MKKNGIKISAILLFVLQVILGFKSFMIIRSILDSEIVGNIAKVDKLLLFVGFLSAIFISLILVILVFIAIISKAKRSDDLIEDRTTTKSKKDKGKEKRESDLEKNKRKKAILEKLGNELPTTGNLEQFTEKVLINISKEYDIMQGIFFVKDVDDKVFRKQGTYAYFSEDELREFTEEVGLSGQVAANKKLLNISNIPEKYITVLSGLGKSSPANLLIFPILYQNESIGIVELASFKKFDSFAEEILMEFSLHIGEQLSKLNNDEETSS